MKQDQTQSREQQAQIRIINRRANSSESDHDEFEWFSPFAQRGDNRKMASQSESSPLNPKHHAREQQSQQVITVTPSIEAGSLTSKFIDPAPYQQYNLSNHRKSNSLQKMKQFMQQMDVKDQSTKMTNFNSQQTEYLHSLTHKHIASQEIFNRELEDEEEKIAIISARDTQRSVEHQFDSQKVISYHLEGDLILYHVTMNDKQFTLRVLKRHLLDTQQAEKYQRELLQASNLEISPQIEKIYQEENDFIILTRYLESSNILEYIQKNNKQQTLSRNIELLMKVLIKYEEMKHALQINAHGNLKLTNIFYEPVNQIIYFMDFQDIYKSLRGQREQDKQICVYEPRINEPRSDTKHLGQLILAIFMGPKSLDHSKKKSDLDLFLKNLTPQLRRIFEILIFEPTSDWNKFRRHTDQLLSMISQINDRPTRNYLKLPINDLPDQSDTQRTFKDSRNATYFIKRKESLASPNLMQNSQPLENSIQDNLIRRNKVYYFIKTFQTAFEHDLVMITYYVNKQEIVFISDEEIPLVTNQVTPFQYTVPIYDMDKLNQYPNSKRPDYDWDIISFVDGSPDAINSLIEQNIKVHDLNQGFNLNKYKMEALFSTLNDENSRLSFTAFDNNSQRPYTVKLKRWRDDKDFFEFVQEYIVVKHLSNYSYPKVTVSYEKSKNVQKIAKSYLKSLYQQTSYITELVSNDHDLKDLDVLEFSSNVVKSAMRLQYSKMNGVLPLYDCYVVKQGYVKTIVMVYDFFDFNLKEYLSQFYEDDYSKRHYKKMFTEPDQLNIMYCISKASSFMEKLGVYFNNYCPENIVFAKGRPNKQQQPKIMLWNFDQCKLKNIPPNTVVERRYSSALQFQDNLETVNTIWQKHQHYQYFKHSQNLKYLAPEVLRKIEMNKSYQVTVKVDPSKKDSYNVGVLMMELYLQRLLPQNEISYQRQLLDSNSVVANALFQLLDENIGSRWSLKLFSKYVKQQRKNLSDSSLVLSWSLIDQMKSFIDFSDDYANEDYLLTTKNDMSLLFKGKCLRLTGQITQAREVLAELRDKYVTNLFRCQESWKTELCLFRELAQYYRDEQNMELSYYYFEKLFLLFKKHEKTQVIDQAELMIQFAQVKQEKQMIQSSQQSFEQALLLLRKYYENDIGQPQFIRIQFQLGLLFFNVGDAHKALNCFDQTQIIVANTFTQFAPICGLQVYYHNLGQTYKYSRITQSLISQGIQGPMMLECLQKQAQCFHMMAKYENSLHLFQQVAKIFKDMSLLVIKSEWSDIVNAEQNQPELIQIQEQIYNLGLNYLHPGLAATYNGIAECYRVLLKNRESIIWYQKAIQCLDLDNASEEELIGSSRVNNVPYFMKAERIHIQAQITNNIGIAFKNLGLFTKSIEAFQTSIGLKQSVFGKQTDRIAEPLFNIGNLQLRAGRFSECLAIYDEVTNLLGGKENTSFYAEVLQNKGLANYYLGNMQKAHQILKESLTICKQIHGGQSLAVGLTLSNIGLVYLSQNQFRKASGLLEEASRYLKRYLPENHPSRQVLEQNLKKCVLYKK